MTEEERRAIETLQYLCSDDCINKDIIKTIVNLIEKLKKEIEEKTTIIFAGAEKVKSLQKENEELKEDNLGIREENIKLVNCHISYERYTGLDFLLPDKFKYAIPKDKIREKMREYKKLYESGSEDEQTEHIYYDFYIAYEELLEEE